MAIQNILLRERKYAQTKIALTREMVKHLNMQKKLRDIAVKDLCEAIPVSEVTFYNYFPKKTDMLVYLWQLWHLESAWHLQEWEKTKRNLEIIETYFEFTARGIEQYPWVLGEALAFFMQKREKFRFAELTVAERLLAYPELPGIETIDIPERPTQKAMLYSYVTRAIAGGELPKATDPDMVTNMLIAILSGVMMTVLETASGQMRSTYHRMLHFLWQGVRAEETTREHVFQEQSINDNAFKHAWKGTYLV